MSIHNLSLLLISILHSCKSTVFITAPGLTLTVDIAADMKLRDIQQQCPELSNYDGIRFSGQEYLFNDEELSNIGIGPESNVEAFKASTDCYFLTRIFDQTNACDILQNWSKVTDLRSNECCVWWEGILCDQYGKISWIYLQSFSPNDLTGSLDLTKLSSMSSLTKFDVTNNRLTGIIDLTRLPQSLESIIFTGNAFSGSVNLTTLPSSLRYLSLMFNQLTGTPDLTKLPESITSLCLSHNLFTGSLNLTTLPSILDSLYLSDNRFTGTPDLTQLPASLMYLTFHHNRFTGTPDLTRLPSSGSLVLIDSSYNEFTGTPDVTRLPISLRQLYLNDNPFTGFVNLTALPSSLVVSICNTGITTRQLINFDFVVIISMINISIFMVIIFYSFKSSKSSNNETCQFSYLILFIEVFDTICHWILSINILLIPNYLGSILMILIIIGNIILVSKYLLLLNVCQNIKCNVSSEIFGLLIGNVEDIPSIIISVIINEHFGYKAIIYIITMLCLIMSLISVVTKIRVLVYCEYFNKNDANKNDANKNTKQTKTTEGFEYT